MAKDKRAYSILIIEDNDGDFTIVEDLLHERISTPDIIHARDFKAAQAILSACERFDIVLLDISLPDKSGEQLIEQILELCLLTPVVILTGYTDTEFSIRAITKGIMDYILKDEITSLALYKSIVYAIERKKSIMALTQSEKRYSDLFQLSPQPIMLFDKETFQFVHVNQAATALYGYSEEEFMSMTLMDVKMEEDIIKATNNMRKDAHNKNIFKETIRHHKKSGEIMEIEIYSSPIVVDGRNLRLVIAIDVTEKNRYEHQITKAIIKAQEDERYEIGGELHDNVCQILAASMLSLAMLKKYLPGKELHWFNSCSGNIVLATDEIRNLSHRLAPAFFDETTLEEAFRVLLNSFNVDNKYTITLSFTLVMEDKDISLDLQLNLYRILQEQLKNILKYAAATTINVDLLTYNNNLKMGISDNGKGFDMATIKKGIGIANMKRRAELFGGRLQIETSPGDGCTVVVDIPFG